LPQEEEVLDCTLACTAPAAAAAAEGGVRVDVTTDVALVLEAAEAAEPAMTQRVCCLMSELAVITSRKQHTDMWAREQGISKWLVFR